MCVQEGRDWLLESDSCLSVQLWSVSASLGMCNNQVWFPSEFIARLWSQGSPFSRGCTSDGAGVKRQSWPLIFLLFSEGIERDPPFSFRRGGCDDIRGAERREVTSLLSVLNVQTAVDWAGFTGNATTQLSLLSWSCASLHVMAEPRGKQLRIFFWVAVQGF